MTIMTQDRILVLGDLHFGTRRSSKVFHDILLKELNWFLTKVAKSDSVVILGDIFDSRSSVDFGILNDAWEFFIRLSRSCKELFVLAGNHDEYYKEFSRETTNCRFLEFEPGSDSKIAPVKVVTELSEINIAGRNCLFIPWIDNEDKLNAAKKTLGGKIDVVFGHFDTVGLYHNTDAESIPLSFKSDDFPDNLLVLSGHYHKRLERGNVKYVGSYINTTFNDLDETKGYHIVSDAGVEFIPNTSPLFRYINIENPTTFIKAYNAATDSDKEQIHKSVSGNFIKLFLNEYKKENDDVFKIIKAMNPIDVTVAFNRINLETEEDTGFDGFDNKTDVAVFLVDYLDTIKEKIPSEISLESVKNLINQKNLEYKQNLSA